MNRVTTNRRGYAKKLHGSKSKRYVVLSRGGRVKVVIGRARVGAGLFLQDTKTGRLDVHIAVYPPDKRKRDLDNLPKSILDSLQHAGIYEDDSQIDKLTVERMAIRKGGEVVVTITEREAE